MATGIIAEYNPFHKGHKYHIDETKKITNDDIVAIISGNFVQRGEPAITDKHTRTKMALLNGVSMVLELPVEYATGSADVFARGAVGILNSCGIIKQISFGSEKGNTDAFEKTAVLLNNEPNNFKMLIKKHLNTGFSYPSARNKALEDYFGESLDFLNKPNNILALEYIRQIKRLNSNIKPLTIERIVSQYNSTILSGEISSASAIRAAIMDKNDSALNSMPHNCTALLRNNKIPALNDYSHILSYILRTKSPKEISEYADVTEGLENRIINSSFKNISDLINSIKTKRYTYTKLQRAILHIILEITKEDQKKEPQYIRILGFRKDKKYLLSELIEKASLPVVTSVKKNEKLLKREITASDIYNILRDNEKGTEYTAPMVIL